MKTSPLIQKARKTPYIFWNDIQDLINESKDEEEKKILHGIMIEKYHLDEYYAHGTI